MSDTSQRSGTVPKNLSLHKMIPNMITLTALAAGMTSIKFAIAERWEDAVLAIIVAAFMDAFDGAAARLLKAQSKLGAELDSFSDFLCFGVAPALLIYLWQLDTAGRWGWPICLIFTIAVALRLSRFNIASDVHDPADPLSKYFTGVPSPMGGALCLLPLVLSFQTEGDFMNFMQSRTFIGGWTLVVAAMMVSNIPTFSSKQIRIPYRMKMPALALFGILLAGLINAPWPTLTFVAIAYLLMLPFSMRHFKRKQTAIGLCGDELAEHDTE